jgi:hypothetical protein
MPNLLHLIWLAFGSFGLQVEYFGHIYSCKDVMASANPLLEAQSFQKLTHPGKRNIRIGVAAQNLS